MVYAVAKSIAEPLDPKSRIWTKRPIPNEIVHRKIVPLQHLLGRLKNEVNANGAQSPDLDRRRGHPIDNENSEHKLSPTMTMCATTKRFIRPSDNGQLSRLTSLGDSSAISRMIARKGFISLRIKNLRTEPRVNVKWCVSPCSIFPNMGH